MEQDSANHAAYWASEEEMKPLKRLYYILLGIVMLGLRAVYAAIYVAPHYLEDLGRTWSLAVRKPKNKTSMTHEDKMRFIRNIGFNTYERIPATYRGTYDQRRIEEQNEHQRQA